MRLYSMLDSLDGKSTEAIKKFLIRFASKANKSYKDGSSQIFWGRII